MANERRVRSNFEHGTITDNPLTAAALNINSAQFATIPAIDATEHGILVLDPKGINGDPEIVKIIAHTAATTVVTVERGKEGDNPARSHPQGTTWIWAPTRYDYLGQFTSSTRPTADIYRGQVLFEHDTNRFIGRSTADIWQGIHLFADPPACRVFHSINQSFADSTEASVAFNSERFDTDNMHDTVTNNSRITFNTAGLYVIMYNGAFESAGDYAQHYALIRLNGLTTLALETRIPAALAHFPRNMLSTIYKFAVGDFVEVRTFQDNTANAARNLLAAAQESPEFSAVWVGRG